MHRFAMEVPMVKSFRQLLVWQKAMDLADAVYTITVDFPRSEMFGLVSQLRRAAVSIPSNIAEGRAIGGGRFMHHLRIAIGSEAELQTQVELSVRRSYLSADQARIVLQRSAEVCRMLHGLHAALKARQARTRTAVTTAIVLALHAGGFLPI
jgi:four helix bundle protein